jgi:hypothetical protein
MLFVLFHKSLIFCYFVISIINIIKRDKLVLVYDHPVQLFIQLDSFPWTFYCIF